LAKTCGRLRASLSAGMTTLTFGQGWVQARIDGSLPADPASSYTGSFRREPSDDEHRAVIWLTCMSLPIINSPLQAPGRPDTDPEKAALVEAAVMFVCLCV